MRLVSSFTLRLYLFWFVWVSSRTFLLAGFLSFSILIYVYFSKGMPLFTNETIEAMKDVFLFSFPITFSLSLILSLLLVFKAVFSKEFKGKRLYLYDCSDEAIKTPLLSDVTRIWRKWLFVSIWMILVFLVLLFGVHQLFFKTLLPLSYFNIYTMYLLVMVFGGLSFSLGLTRCKKIRIKDV